MDRPTDSAEDPNFWAPWCAPCAEELPDLAALAARRKQTRFVGVSVELDKKADVLAAIDEHGLTYDQFYADDALMASFFGEDGEAPLPSTFVFDAGGKLVRAFHRKVTRAELGAVLDGLRDGPLHLRYIKPIVESHIVRGEYGEAQAVLERALKAKPEDATLLTQLGNVLSMQGKHADAVPHLEKATRLQPEAAYAWYVLGVAHKKLARPGQALPAFEKAVALDPKNTEAQMSLGAAYSQARRPADALRVFEAIVEADPSSKRGWLNLGKARALAGAPGAGDAFNKVLELDPNHREARALLERFRGH